jgi:hypothetical protein
VRQHDEAISLPIIDHFAEIWLVNFPLQLIIVKIFGGHIRTTKRSIAFSIDMHSMLISCA